MISYLCTFWVGVDSGESIHGISGPLLLGIMVPSFFGCTSIDSALGLEEVKLELELEEDDFECFDTLSYFVNGTACSIVASSFSL